MVTKQEIKRISKFLSLVLRHRPDLIHIQLDDNGWADVNLLISNAQIKGFALSNELLKTIVDTNDKRRFILDKKLNRIRATQGHSVSVELEYEARKPPEILYHGTSAQFLESILLTGLNKQSRQHVHLSTDMDIVLSIGKRTGKPIVIEVFAGIMYNDGYLFYLSDNNVWLTDNVPNRYLNLFTKL